MTPYDAVEYPTFPQAQTHPDRLATLATVFGMTPAPVERCRVLEVGTGDGGNLIPMAFALPGSEFTGLDLARAPIAAGSRVVEELGLRNIRLLAMDLMDMGEDFGEFDYIIAHGLYSWIPEPVRDKLLAICRRHLAPQGVAFVSYNVYPGCHVRDMLRGIMLYHTEGMEDSAQVIREARAIIELIRSAGAEKGLDDDLHNLLIRQPGALYHDDLAEISHPVYFHQFAAHAARQGLQFLGEANFYAMQPAAVPETPRRALEALEGDVIRQQQYLDFMKLRRFRQTLLCHGEIALDRPPKPARIRGLLASSHAKPGPTGPGGVVEFVGELGAKAQTAHPLAKTALRHLAEVWPQRVDFSCLLELAREKNAEALSEILLYSYTAGLIELHAHAPAFAARAGAQPQVSALARLQSRQGPWVATLCHGLAEIDEAIGRRLIELLDGTRDRAALARDLAPMVPGGKVTPAALDQSLERLARLPLLTR